MSKRFYNKRMAPLDPVSKVSPPKNCDIKEKFSSEKHAIFLAKKGIEFLKVSDCTQALYWFNQALQESQECKDFPKEDKACIYLNMASAYIWTKQIKPARRTLNHVFKIKREIYGKSRELAEVYQVAAKMFAKIKCNEEYSTYIYQYYNIISELKSENCVERAEFKVKMAGICCERKIFVLALRHYEQALNIYQEENPDNFRKISAIHIYVSNILFITDQFFKSSVHFKEAIKLQTLCVDENNIHLALACCHLSTFYQSSNHLDRAIRLQKRAIRILKILEQKAENREHLGTCYIKLGETYESLQDKFAENQAYQSALEYFSTDAPEAKSCKNKIELLERYLNELAFGKGAIREAEKFESKSDRVLAEACYKKAINHLLPFPYLMNSVFVNYCRSRISILKNDSLWQTASYLRIFKSGKAKHQFDEMKELVSKNRF